MSNQYFENNENLISKEHQFSYYYKQHRLQFITDLGVFSKKEVDFGTSLLLKTVELEKEDAEILDVGCGYGPIGISLAKNYPHATVDMIDVNLRALSLASKNAKLNNISNVHIFESNLYRAINKSYDVIISNPPIRAGKAIVHQILTEAPLYLKEDGSLWIVIQKKQGAPSAIAKLNEVFEKVETVTKDKGYFIIKSSKKRL